MLSTRPTTPSATGPASGPGTSTDTVTVPRQRTGRPVGVAEWAVDAACRNSDPDALFVQGAAQNQAKVVCRACPVRVACLADALDNRVEFGVWGGMTERERRALLRRRPNVTSWRRLLEAAARDQKCTATAAAG